MHITNLHFSQVGKMNLAIAFEIPYLLMLQFNLIKFLKPDFCIIFAPP